MELERVAALHWRGVEEQTLGEWVLRAADGFTGRANSALPGGDPGRPLDEALEAVTDWYRSRGLPPMVQVALPADGGLGAGGFGELDEELARRGWGIRSGAAFVMTVTPSALTTPPGLTAPVRVDGELTPEWLGMHRYRGQSELPPVRLKVLTSAPEQAFVSLAVPEAGAGTREVRETAAGEKIAAVARLSFAGGWAGITAVEVDPLWRRGGLGTAITAACCECAFEKGVKRVFLQVETGNEAARALYERCGFTYHHRYQYRVLPA